MCVCVHVYLDDGERPLAAGVPHVDLGLRSDLTRRHDVLELGVFVHSEADDVIGVLQVERLVTCRRKTADVTFTYDCCDMRSLPITEFGFGGTVLPYLRAALSSPRAVRPCGTLTA